MADPVSVLAVAGLIYAGRKLSEVPEQPKKVVEKEPELYDTEYEEIEFSDPFTDRKSEVDSFSVIAPQNRTGGQELLEMRGRLYDQGRMNNLSPVEKKLVGPGLGVGADVESAGGYQQVFRVNPVNTGAYRLTTLPGRSGPAVDTKGGRRAEIGKVSYNHPEKTAYLPERRPPTLGRAQGMSGVVPRASHQKAMRTTNRSQTGHRVDGLDKTPGRRFIPGQTLPQNPTRNKEDIHDAQFMHVNNPSPGITNFYGGYMVSPAVRMGVEGTNGHAGYSVDQQFAFGIRPDERRAKPNRMGNPGRMNVREKPVNQHGALTTIRHDKTRIDGRTGAANGGWTQNYQVNKYTELNPYKGAPNPHVMGNRLDLAKNQLANNPFSKSIN
jgi:hypothetical protein